MEEGVSQTTPQKKVKKLVLSKCGEREWATWWTVPRGWPVGRAPEDRAHGRGGQPGEAGRVTGACSRKECRPHLRAGPSRGGAAGPARGCQGVQEGRRSKASGGRPTASPYPAPGPPQQQRLERALVLVQRAAERGAPQLLSSSAARQYWSLLLPAAPGYVCWMNFTSGLARSTSEVFSAVLR